MFATDASFFIDKKINTCNHLSMREKLLGSWGSMDPVMPLFRGRGSVVKTTTAAASASSSVEISKHVCSMIINYYVIMT